MQWNLFFFNFCSLFLFSYVLITMIFRNSNFNFHIIGKSKDPMDWVQHSWWINISIVAKVRNDAIHTKRNIDKGSWYSLISSSLMIPKISLEFHQERISWAKTFLVRYTFPSCLSHWPLDATSWNQPFLIVLGDCFPVLRFDQPRASKLFASKSERITEIHNHTRK